MVPVAVHGASTSTSGAVSCTSRASPSTMVAQRPVRARFSRMRPARTGSISTAVTRAPAAASCMVLPPGAAHRSMTRLPRTSPSRFAGSVAAASCTHQSPSAKPAIASIRPPAFSRRTRPNSPSLSGKDAASAFRTISVGASFRCAWAILRAVSPSYCSRQRPHSQSGTDSRTQSNPTRTSTPSRAIRRSTALISGLKCTAFLSLAASALAPLTAAWSAVLSTRSSQAPSSNISLAGPALCGGGGLGTKWRTTASSTPRWRSVWLTSARAKPASRVASPSSESS